jgi:hypothetical protein
MEYIFAMCAHVRADANAYDKTCGLGSHFNKQDAIGMQWYERNQI